MLRWVLAIGSALLLARPAPAHAICVAPECQRICETAPSSAYYRAEVSTAAHVQLLERLGGNPLIDAPAGLEIEAPYPATTLEPGTLVLVSVTNPVGADFEVFDIVVVRHQYPNGEFVCGDLTVYDYMAIAASDRCDEIAAEEGLVLTECNDTPRHDRGCNAAGGGLAVALLALFVRRRSRAYNARHSRRSSA